MNRTTQVQDSAEKSVMYMALDVGNKTWVAAFATDLRSKPRVRVIKATAEKDKRAVLLDEVAAARAALGAESGTAVRSCYESGAEGNWLHRWLQAQGIDNVIVHPNSVGSQRRGKQAKTDRIDAQTLLGHLVRDHRGDATEPLRKVEVPPVEAEDMRAFTRGLADLHKQETILHNRLQSLLRSQGIDEAYHAGLAERLPELVAGDGRPLGPWLRLELERLCEQLAWTHGKIGEWEAERLRMVTEPETELEQKAQMLAGLRGIGPVAATVLVFEMLGWREFKNGKKVGSFLGLAPTPHASGTMDRDLGISKAGPSHLRALMIQLAWAWLRYQPDSQLSRWYQAHVGGTGKRSKRVAIVAVARMLAVALWKYAKFGEVPHGALEKTPLQRVRMAPVRITRRRTASTRRTRQGKAA